MTTLNGHVYYVTDVTKAFAPVILGDDLPTSGYEAWPGAKVTATYYWPIFGQLPLWATSATVAGNGSFELAEPPAEIRTLVDAVSLTVTAGPPVYRSGYISLAEAQSKELDIWLYPDTLPTADGISAGAVSQVVNGQGLPGNTTLTAGGPYGLNFSGSDGQVSLEFNVVIAPDTSPDLTDFLDLSINGWDINVGWPTSWFESADDVLNKILSGIAGAGGSMNTAVLARMEGILESQEGLSSKTAANFLDNEVSVTFYGVGYPNKHSWNIGDTSDRTIVLVANPCIGFPRNFSVDPHRS